MRARSVNTRQTAVTSCHGSPSQEDDAPQVTTTGQEHATGDGCCHDDAAKGNGVGRAAGSCHGHADSSDAKDERTARCCHGHGAPADARHQTPAGKYICACCPGVESDEPGNCPHCGMALQRVGGGETKTQYTCPMHPEIVRDEPGDCPICGMALEPMTATVEEGPSAELKSMTRNAGSGPHAPTTSNR
ncbi:MAG: heavy metal-binding domain-containing protein [Halofilum sp. (in: g-proteobacteria)]|nr:heavy metal-binding domain-containing protein [Halofilum sp. (in: g-proteobacteria)]